MLEAGTLIHTARLYKEVSTSGYGGTTLKSLEMQNTVKCSVADKSYQQKQVGNKNVLDTDLKITTHYFKDVSINMLVQINDDGTLYKIIYIENLDFKNRVLIFSLVKHEERIND